MPPGMDPLRHKGEEAMANARAKQDQLAYALITPYSLHKSRTGGILARLLWGNVRLVAARMYAPRPDGEMLQEYCDAIHDPREQHVPLYYQKMLIKYVMENFTRPNVRGISNRMMLLVLRGPNAQREILDAVGHISQDVRGDNVRGTFGDFVSEEPTSPALQEARRRAAETLSRNPAFDKIELPVRRGDFFEPAVLTGVTHEMTEAHLKLFRKCAYSDGGLVLDAIEGIDTSKFETSMVILKPESLRRRNPLPGNLVDFFARTRMYITAAKMIHMSVEKAGAFYSLKLPQFREQLKGMVERKARDIVRKARLMAQVAVRTLGADPEEAFDPKKAIPAVREAEYMFRTPKQGEPGEVKEPVLEELLRILPERLENLEPEDSFYGELAEDLKDINARAEFNELIRYMSGEDAETGRPLEKGPETLCLALLYSGENGLKVIRQRLKELREIYGQNILRNRAHATDPEEDPIREMEILGMPSAPGGEARPCDVEQVVSEFFGPH